MAFGESRGWNPVCRPPRKPILFSSQPRLCAILQFRLLVRNQIWPRWKEQLHGQFHSSRSYQVLRGLAFLGYLAYSLMLNVTLESFVWLVWLTKPCFCHKEKCMLNLDRFKAKTRTCFFYHVTLKNIALSSAELSAVIG